MKVSINQGSVVYAGLFSHVSKNIFENLVGGNIFDLTLSNVNITVTSEKLMWATNNVYVGGIAGRASNVSFENCMVSGNILVYNPGSTAISGSHISNVGGIVGIASNTHRNIPVCQTYIHAQPFYQGCPLSA